MVLEQDKAARGFAALGSEPRLQVLRCLVRAGDAGLLFGTVQARTGIPAATLSHHLRALAQVGLIVQDRQGRQTRNRLDFDRLRALSAFLLTECCAEAACCVEAAPDALESESQPEAPAQPEILETAS